MYLLNKLCLNKMCFDANALQCAHTHTHTFHPFGSLNVIMHCMQFEFDMHSLEIRKKSRLWSYTRTLEHTNIEWQLSFCFLLLHTQSNAMPKLEHCSHLDLYFHFYFSFFLLLLFFSTWSDSSFMIAYELRKMACRTLCNLTNATDTHTARDRENKKLCDFSVSSQNL